MKRRNIRKKRSNTDEKEEESVIPGQKERVGAGLLSFDFDEEPVITTIKKSSKRNLKDNLQSEVLKMNLPSTQTSAPGSYTAEKIAEMKKHMTAGRASQDKETQMEKETPLIKISGSFKPDKPTPANPVEAFIRVKEDLKEEDVSRKEPTPQEEEEGFVPPNVHTIKLAKAKRERLRQAQLAPDYLPLGGASNLLSSDFKSHEKERKGSGTDSEDDDGNRRLQFLGVQKPQKPKQLNEEDGLDLLEDEEGVDSFADVQSRKGVRSLGVAELSPQQGSGATLPAGPETGSYVLPVVTRFSIHAKAEEAMENIEKEIEKLKIDQDMTERNVFVTKQNLNQALEDIEKTKERIEEAGSKYKDVQEMKEYISDLCDCLKEKLPYIEEMEEHLVDLYGKEQERLLEEEEMCVEDRIVAETASEVVHQVMAASGTTGMATVRAQQAVQDQESQFVANGSPDRSEKRKLRREGCQNLAQQGSFNLIPDPILNIETEDLEIEEQLREMKETAESLFADSLPIFGDLHSIKKEFEGWRQRQKGMYSMAYIPDSLPALFAPFMRLEVLTWSPFHGSDLGLESQKWYSEIESYGVDSEEDELVPELVKQILVPAVRLQLTKCWSPFHLHRSVTAAEMIRETLVYVKMEDVELQKVLQLVQKRLEEAVEKSGVPPYPQIALTTAPIVQGVMEVRYRRCLHLIGSIVCFHDILPIASLQKLLLQDTICNNLLPYFRNLAVDPESCLPKMMKIFDLMPTAWFQQEENSRELNQVLDVLNSLIRSMMKRRKELVRKQKRDGVFKNLIGSFVDLLKELGSNQKASEVENIFL